MSIDKLPLQRFRIIIKCPNPGKGKEGFNPNTYCGQRLLLIEARSSGQAVEFFNQERKTCSRCGFVMQAKLGQVESLGPVESPFEEVLERRGRLPRINPPIRFDGIDRRS